MSRRWTPERVIDLGLGPADVARLLTLRGWRVVLASAWPGFLCCEVVAVKSGSIRLLYDRGTQTRRREAKMLSQALGGRYSFGARTGSHRPSDWPSDWNHARHNLTERLLATDGQPGAW